MKKSSRNVIELQSTYSFRMFEILKTYEFRKTIDLDVDYLRKILDVTEKYKSYKDFRIYIIDKAKDDLAKYCDIAFTYEANKASKGKKVESITFHIFKNDAPGRDSKSEGTNSKREKMTEEINFVEVDKNGTFEQREKMMELRESIIKGNKDENTNEMLEKLVLELSPIVVSQFGVSLKVFLDLAESHTEGVVRQAIEVTLKALQVGKVENVAGFFVGAVRGKYIEPKQKTKEIEVEKKVKLEVEKAVEQDAKNKIAEEKRQEGARKIQIIKYLIAVQAPIINEAIEEIQKGMFKTAYKPQKSILENLEYPMFIGAMMNVLEKLNPDIFPKE